MPTFKTFTETAQRVGDVLKREWDKLFNRETITIAEGEVLELGAVLGKLSGTGEYVAHAPGAGDGSEVAAAILLEDSIDATDGALSAAVLARGPAVVARDALIYSSGTTDNEKLAAEADLLAVNIVVREDIGEAAA